MHMATPHPCRREHKAVGKGENQVLLLPTVTALGLPLLAPPVASFGRGPWLDHLKDLSLLLLKLL